MAVQFQFRRGTASEWTAANTILADGELGLETNTNKFKLGNGTSGWNALSYASGTAGTTGATGATGATGTSTTGATGATGATGSVGATGPAGTPGDVNLNRKVIDDAFLGTNFYFNKQFLTSTVAQTTISPITLI